MKRHPIIFRVKKYLQSGFTLIELLVVMVIIGLLAALVVPKFFGHVDKAMQQDAQIQIELLGQALDLHRLENHKYPSTDEGLKHNTSNPQQPLDSGNYGPTTPRA